MAAHIYPNERRFYQEAERLGPWAVFPVVEELKPLAQSAGLWNLFLPAAEGGLTNLEYAPLCEIMGRSHLAPEVFNCSAPDTGNMETILRYGTEAQKERWLKPLLAGEIRSAFAMTEPDVASSDATNVASLIVRDGEDYVINGRKWYTTGATDPRCKIIIFMGQTDPDGADRHRRQSMVLVPKDTPGVRVVRSLPVLGFYGVPDRASEVVFENVRVPVGNILLGEGRGFEIAQGRLGPGRIHHCMRLIGLSERVLERMCRRAEQRVAFGKTLAEQTVTLERIAEARIMIEQSRLLTLKAAHMMDTVGNKAARQEIAMIKVVAPNMAQQIVDWAIQAFGGGGTSNDHFLAAALATTRLLRLADGPDEVHRNQIGRLEIRRYQNTDPARTGGEGRPLSYDEAEELVAGRLMAEPRRPQSLTAPGGARGKRHVSIRSATRHRFSAVRGLRSRDAAERAPLPRPRPRVDFGDAGQRRKSGAQAFSPHRRSARRERAEIRRGPCRNPSEARDALRAHAEAGFFALGFDEAVGGLQAPTVAVLMASGIFTCANLSLANYAFLTVANANMLRAFGTEDQRRRYLPPMLEGRWFGTMCLSEPQAGSSLADIATKAEPLPDGSYRLKGSKMWISGGDHELADNIVHMVLAKIQEARRG